MFERNYFVALEEMEGLTPQAHSSLSGLHPDFEDGHIFSVTSVESGTQTLFFYNTQREVFFVNEEPKLAEKMAQELETDEELFWKLISKFGEEAIRDSNEEKLLLLLFRIKKEDL